MPRDFLYNHRQFAGLIRIVAEAQGIAPALRHVLAIVSRSSAPATLRR
ncbi:hypothetical protein [Phenylobacterium sp.]|nr:hypothetical protein [Phenylobacterium sp.]MDP3592117.1 hypothetical protein [Phenylobacterium sp.]